MNKELLASLEGKTKEEQAKIIRNYKSSLQSSDLQAVNGGENTEDPKENPNSEEVPYKGNWYSSFGFVCDGERIC